MAEIVKQSWVEHIEEYRLVFDTDPARGTGYSFPCDKNGNLLLGELSKTALENLAICRRSDTTPHVVNYSRNYRHPAVIACDECGCSVYLDGFTNTCGNCEADYNMSGQRLAPRNQWGEETGETAVDILMGGSDDD